MPGTREGGRKAAARNKMLFGQDYYKVIGKIGGSAERSKPAGFAADPYRARWAGRIGGLTSRKSRG